MECDAACAILSLMKMITKKITSLATLYFQRRRALRIVLLLVIASLWAYTEISDLVTIKAHDLNYRGLQEITARYKAGRAIVVCCSGRHQEQPGIR